MDVARIKNNAIYSTALSNILRFLEPRHPRFDVSELHRICEATSI